MVAVFFAEVRHRARLDSLVEIHHVRNHLFVLQDVLVYEVFDVEPVLLAERRIVREVEAQAVGRNERPGLLDVRPQHRPKRRVKQVRACVIAANGVTPLGVDDRGHAVFGRQNVIREPLNLVHDKPGDGAKSV